jgi:hypothetical protein
VNLPGDAKPVIFNGKTAITAHCQDQKKIYLGRGAYPHDMYLSNEGDRAIFNFHIRAVTNDGCHVDFPSILHVEFDTQQKIRKWTHYYDGDWMNPMINCRSNLQITPKKTNAPSIKALIYETVLAFASDCNQFAYHFGNVGNFSSPTSKNVYTGTNAIAQRCKEINSWFTGAGNYPQDMYIGENVAVFEWHVRAINAHCHVWWPGIVRVQFSNDGKITSFDHYWDEDWTMAAVNCRK